MSPTIVPATERNIFTIINTFRATSREGQDDIIRRLHEATVEVMSSQPGFISANLHRILQSDGPDYYVTNYAQWASREAFEAMFAKPEARQHMLEIEELYPRTWMIGEVVACYESKR